MEPIYLVYGLAFFMLGIVVSMLLERRAWKIRGDAPQTQPPLTPLSFFDAAWLNGRLCFHRWDLLPSPSQSVLVFSSPQGYTTIVVIF